MRSCKLPDWLTTTSSPASASAQANETPPERSQAELLPLSMQLSDCRAGSPHEVQDQRNHGQDQQQVDQRAGDMKHPEAEDPSQQQDNEQNGEDTHLVPSDTKRFLHWSGRGAPRLALIFNAGGTTPR